MQRPEYQLQEAKTGRIVLTRLEFARSLWKQTIGLLGRSQLPADYGLWLEPCNSIHTFGMQFTIDVLFLDKTGLLIRVVSQLKPWRVCWPVSKARVVIEMPAGSIRARNIQVGIRYIISEK